MLDEAFVLEFLTVGNPVTREDGRFYVPVARVDALDGVPSQIVFRVASDAFLTLDDAVSFATKLVDEHNANLMADQATELLDDDDDPVFDEECGEFVDDMDDYHG
jgi:hypothetical protein